MDHEEVRDCPFSGTCETFADPLIGPACKGPAGLGCRGRNDLYRAKHCKPFACKYLAVVFHDALLQPAPRPVAGDARTAR